MENYDNFDQCYKQLIRERTKPSSHAPISTIQCEITDLSNINSNNTISSTTGTDSSISSTSVEAPRVVEAPVSVEVLELLTEAKEMLLDQKSKMVESGKYLSTT